jgi:hypothetical protein
MFKNSNLKEDFPFLISEAEKLHPNAPQRAALLRIAKDLFLLDRQDTLAFVETVEDAVTMFYVLSSACWVRFPSKTFLAALKIQMDQFKDTGNYELLKLHYQKAVKYLEDLEADKINTRAYQAELKKNKQ